MAIIQRQWSEPDSNPVPEGFRDELNKKLGETTHPLLAKILVERGFTDIEAALDFISPSRYVPSPASEFPGILKAVSRINSAIASGESITVWGDFDVDGQTSTALLVEALRCLGAKVNYYIPSREKESHGVHIPSLKRLIDNGTNLLITCDTGISAVNEVIYASKHGVDVIVTDHHELPATLPPAFSLINPHFLPPGHPLRSLPGVGVAYKLVEALFDEYGKPEELSQFLDLAVLGIIADVAELKADTRYLAQKGLDALRKSHRIGLQTLFTLAELNPDLLTEEHIGFMIGPRLNALGRLGDANKGVEFLITEEPDTAYLLGVELEGLNAQRQLLSEQVFRGALAQLERDPSISGFNALVLSHPSWPAGIIGIVASRLAELYGKPVVLLSAPPDETTARGSARSVPEVDIIKAISSQSEILTSFGGHTMAAGLAVAAQNIDALRIGLSKAIGKQIGKSLPTQPVKIDALVTLEELSLEMVADISRMGPFGAGNPEVIFGAKDVTITNRRLIGRSNEHVLLTIVDQAGTEMVVMWWQGAQYPYPAENFDLAFTARTSDFRGKRSLQLTWITARDQVPAGPTPVEKAPIQWMDKRQESNLLRSLQEILSDDPEAQIWSEGGVSLNLIQAHNRTQLTRARTLVILTRPPSRQAIQHAIQTVDPEIIYAFSAQQDMDDVQMLTRRLSGLLKYTINHYNGKVEIDTLAALCAHNTSTIRFCLEMLFTKGVFEIEHLDRGLVFVKEGEQGRGNRSTSNKDNGALLKLRAALAETKAFRNYFSTAPLEFLA